MPSAANDVTGVRFAHTIPNLLAGRILRSHQFIQDVEDLAELEVTICDLQFASSAGVRIIR